MVCMCNAYVLIINLVVHLLAFVDRSNNPVATGLSIFASLDMRHERNLTAFKLDHCTLNVISIDLDNARARILIYK